VPDILAITGPIFLLIGLGYGAVRAGWFDRALLPALARFVIAFALPALIFRALGQRSLAEVVNGDSGRYLLAYAGGSLLALGAGLLWARGRGQTRDAAAMTGMGMSCANTAFVGFPVALQVIGPEASVAMALTLMVENLLMIPLCLALADSAPRAGQPVVPFARALGRSLLGLRGNPIVLGIVAGLVSALLAWKMPVPLARAVDLLANASSAVSLFFVGGVLVGLPVRGLAQQVGAVALGKLLLHPLAVWALLCVVGPLPPAQQWAAVLLAGAPMLAIYPILGHKYGRQQANAASLLVATAGAFAGLSAWIWAVRQGLPGL